MILMILINRKSVFKNKKGRKSHDIINHSLSLDAWSNTSVKNEYTVWSPIPPSRFIWTRKGNNNICENSLSSRFPFYRAFIKKGFSLFLLMSVLLWSIVRQLEAPFFFRLYVENRCLGFEMQ